MVDHDNVIEKLHALEIKVHRLEFALLYMLIIMFLLFSFSIYLKK